MAASPTETNGDLPKRFIGLEGLWRSVANFGLVGVMTALLTYLVVTSRQDVVQIREEAKQAHAAMAEMTGTLKDNRDATQEMSRAIRSLTREIRELNNGNDPSKPKPIDP